MQWLLPPLLPCASPVGLPKCHPWETGNFVEDLHDDIHDFSNEQIKAVLKWRDFYHKSTVGGHAARGQLPSSRPVLPCIGGAFHPQRMRCRSWVVGAALAHEWRPRITSPRPHVPLAPRAIRVDTHMPYNTLYRRSTTWWATWSAPFTTRTAGPPPSSSASRRWMGAGAREGWCRIRPRTCSPATRGGARRQVGRGLDGEERTAAGRGSGYLSDPDFAGPGWWTLPWGA